jgi:cell wall-associated NlpC family hydrolase
MKFRKLIIILIQVSSMSSGNLSDFISRAQAYCWDESHGYTIGGMGYPDFDCSGFIGRCLYEAGFDYPSYHIGTMNMDDNPMSSMNTLGAAGFQLIHVTDLNNMPALKHGDIFVLNSYTSDWQANGGHTFIYCEDIPAYVDYAAYSDVVATIPHAKVEASSSRGETSPGDHRRDGTGAYWEVWCHAYWELVTGYSFTDPGDEIYLAHWPPGLEGIPILVMKHIMDKNFGRKDAAATILS